MKKKLLSLGLLGISAAAFCVADIAGSAEPVNLDFTEGTPIVGGVCTYAKDKETNGVEFSGLTPVTGWTPSAVDEDGMAGGLFAYGSGAWLGGADYKVPETNAEGEAQGNALGILAVWSAQAQYTQPIELAAGENTIVFSLINIAGTGAMDKNCFGFIAEDGTEYLAATKNYPVGEWTVETVTVMCDEPMAGSLSIGFKASNTGSGSNQHIFVDKVEIENVYKAPADMSALEAAIAAAEEHALGFEAGEYAPYNNIVALQALADAKALLAHVQYSQEIVDEAAAALENATWTANETALNAIYDGTFHLCEADGPVAYWSGVNKGGYGNSRAFVYAEPAEDASESYIANYEYMGALQPAEGTRAGLYLRYYENPGAWYNYGGQPGYNMPLEGKVKYHFSCDFGQWGEGDGDNNIQIFDAAGELVASYTGHADHINAEGGKATHVDLEFTPTVSGDCRVSLWSPGDKKHYAVFSNFVIERAADITPIFGDYVGDFKCLDEEGEPYETSNFPAVIGPGEEDNEIVFAGFMPENPEVAIAGKVNPYQRTITFQAQTIAFDEDITARFCSQAAYDADGSFDGALVATYTEDYAIELNGWLLVAAEVEEEVNEEGEVVVSYTYTEPLFTNVETSYVRGHALPEYYACFDNSKSEWETVYAYVWGPDGNVADWPGQECEYIGNNIWVYEFATDLEITNIIFNNNAGIQTEDLVFVNGVTYEGPAAVVPGQTGIYLRGQMTGWDAVDEYKFEYDEENDNYVLNNVTIAAGEEFKIADAEWGAVNYGGVTDMKANEWYNLEEGGANCTLAADFSGKVVFDLDMRMVIFEPTDAIKSIEAENAAEYYNMQGVKVDAPARGNVYIVVKNGKAAKAIVK